MGAPALADPVVPTDHSRGNPAARLVLVEYADFQCPRSAAATLVVRRARALVGENLLVVYRHCPLRLLHPFAFLAAQGAEAAAEQGQFWPMHDLLYENPWALDPQLLLLYAEMLDLDSDRFREALTSSRVNQKVEEQIESALRSGVHETPAFFLNGHRFAADWRLLPDVLEISALGQALPM